MLYFCKRGWVSCSFFFVVTCVCVSQAVENLPPKITRLAPSGYQTVIINENGTPGAVVLLPQAELPNGPAHQWAQDIGLPTIDEVGLNNPLPTYPLQGINPDTNLILLSVGRGGPMVQALRRAMLVIEDQRIPGAGGYAIRVIARPFAASQANVIVISAGDRKSLAKACDVFKQGLKKNGGTIYEKFLVVEPGPQWKKVRSRWYDAQVGDPFFDDLTAFAEGYNKSNGRSFCQLSAQLADRYYGTGNIEFAKLYKKHIYGFRYDIGRDDHMGLHLLVQGWDRIEECSVFTEEDRLKIINFIFQSCSGSEGYENYTVSPDFAYVDPLLARQNHQTITANGLLQGYLYFKRLYDLPEVDKWKRWADDTAAKATVWGGIEDSTNYQVRTFVEVGRHYRLQGLTSKNAPGTDVWLKIARRFISARDNYSMPSTFGDGYTTAGVYVPAGVICGDGIRANYFHDGFLEWMLMLADDWDYAPAQWMIDRIIQARRKIKLDGNSPFTKKLDKRYISHFGLDPTTDEFAYLFGSAKVGGPQSIAEPQLSKKQVDDLKGLIRIPLTKGYYDFRAGKIQSGSRKYFSGDQAWAPTWMPPFDQSVDKVIYRSGWGYDDEYLLVDGMGDDFNHGHWDLGSLVRYMNGGRIWVADFGYDLTGPQHHSKIEITRDGKPDVDYLSWDSKAYEAHAKYYRFWPELAEVVELEPGRSGETGEFSFVLGVNDVSGTSALWTRRLEGGGGRPLEMIDTITAVKAGRYKISWRLRLLGEVSGVKGDWKAVQEGVTLPVKLFVRPEDKVGTQSWNEVVNKAGHHGNRYYWYPYVASVTGPTIVEWNREFDMKAGQKTELHAQLGPVVK